MKSADFHTILRQRPYRRSPHFFFYYVMAAVTLAQQATQQAIKAELSTALQLAEPSPVDEHQQHRLGLVVPKKFAKRAVTRNLIKRQARAIYDHYQAELPPGDYVVRLSAPYAVKDYPSAASNRLKQAVRQELVDIFKQICSQHRRAL